MPARKKIESSTSAPDNPAAGMHENLNSVACEPMTSFAKKNGKKAARRKQLSETNTAPGAENKPEIIEITPEPSKTETRGPEPVSDEKFLDTVRDMVFEKLVDGQLELKIDYGFKAIEIKQKLAEGSQNEKLLLEILNEIRKEELNKTA